MRAVTAGTTLEERSPGGVAPNEVHPDQLAPRDFEPLSPEHDFHRVWAPNDTFEVMTSLRAWASQVCTRPQTAPPPRLVDVVPLVPGVGGFVLLFAHGPACFSLMAYSFERDTLSWPDFISPLLVLCRIERLCHLLAAKLASLREFTLRHHGH